MGGRPDEETFKRVDRYLRLGNATPPVGKSEIVDEYMTYVTQKITSNNMKKAHKYSRGVIKVVDEEKVIYLKGFAISDEIIKKSLVEFSLS